MTLKNASWTLRAVLKGISNIDYPKNLIKLIFVDGGSVDDSLEILKDFVKQVGEKYFKVDVESRHVGITEGRNMALRKSVGLYVLFVDSDVVVPRDILEYLTEKFKEDHKLAFINIPCVREKETRGLLDQLFISRGESMGMSCAAIRLDALNEVGRHFTGTPIAENPLELIHRLSGRGYKALYSQDIYALHLKKTPATFRTYMAVCFHSVPSLHLPLLMKGNLKIIARYAYYSLLLVSIIIIPLYWPIFLAVWIPGLCYHLYRCKGDFKGLLFLASGLILLFGVIKELIKKIKAKR
jgi:glycosyltransferase involved in cell wall biosynthesis